MGLLLLFRGGAEPGVPAYTWQVTVGAAATGDVIASGVMGGALVMGLADSVTETAVDNDITDYIEPGSLRFTESDAGRSSRLDFDVRNPPIALTAWQEVFFTVDPGLATEVVYFGGYIMDSTPSYYRDTGDIVWKVRCEGYMARVLRTPLVRKAYLNRSVGYIVADLFTTAGLTDFDAATYVSAGPTLTIFSTNGETLAATMNRLALVASDKQGVAWTWRIDGERAVWMAPVTDQAAPYGVAEDDYCNWISEFPADLGSVSKKTDTTDIRNRVTVRGGITASDVQTENFTGDGSTVSFQLARRPIRDIVSITVAGVTQSYGTAWYNDRGGSYNCLVNYSAGIVTWPDALPPASSAAIVIKYRYDEPLLVTVSEATSYATFGFWFDYEIEDKSITTEDDATDLAQGILDAYAFGVTSGEFSIRRGGLFSGQLVALTFPDLDLDGQYVIRSVTYEIDPNGYNLRCRAQVGDRSMRFSEVFGGGQSFVRSAYSQTTVPRIEGEVGTIRVRDAILGGAASGYSTGNGFFLGNDGGTQKFRVGAASGGKLAWDGSTLTVGGFTVGSTSLSSGDFVIDTANRYIKWSSTNYFRFNEADNALDWEGNFYVFGYLDARDGVFTDDIEVGGRLIHQGSQVGFFGVGPVTQRAAYTQTYSTAARTVNPASTSAFSGIDNAQAGSVYAQLTDLNALRSDVIALYQIANALIDDSQALGLSA